MKKLLTILILAVSCQASAQVYVGMGIGNTVTATGGVLVSQFQISANYSRPFSSNIRPDVASLELGRQIFIGETGSLTILAGGAKCTYHIVENNEKVGKVNSFKPIYGAELGLDKGMGRMLIYGKYSGTWQAGAGIRFFFN